MNAAVLKTVRGASPSGVRIPPSPALLLKDMSKESEEKLENGIQPIDALLTTLGIKNSDLVSGSSEQLSHKVVAKARKGRRLTINAKHKILNALNAYQKEKTYKLTDLFNY